MVWFGHQNSMTITFKKSHLFSVLKLAMEFLICLMMFKEFWWILSLFIKILKYYTFIPSGKNNQLEDGDLAVKL